MRVFPLTAALLAGLAHGSSDQAYQLDLTDSQRVAILATGSITLSSSGACKFKKTIPAHYIIYDDGEEGREALVDERGQLLWEMENNWQNTRVIEEDNLWQTQRTSTVEPYTLHYFNALSGCDLSSDHLFTNTSNTRFTETEKFSANSDSYQLKLQAQATAFVDVGWQTEYRQQHQSTTLKMSFNAKTVNHY